ncbi:hypothetical protein [Paenibacillus chitinolyticus]
MVEPVKQKDLLHSIINKVTVNLGNNPGERSVKDIELFFDASINDDFMLIYDTVQLNGSIGENYERSWSRQLSLSYSLIMTSLARDDFSGQHISMI